METKRDNNPLTDAEVIANLHNMTDEELQRIGIKRMSFADAPCIEVDDIEEYAKANGYVDQEEYNKRINSAMNR